MRLALVLMALALLGGFLLEKASAGEVANCKPADLSPPVEKSFCSLVKGMTQTQCTNRNRKCWCQYGVGLKWTGSSCGSKTGDGGCRCDQFCGFKCQKKCNNDPNCYWNGSESKCLNKISDLPEGGGQCWQSRAPTTSPTTSTPSAAPVPAPTAAPIIPTQFPTRSPGAAGCNPKPGMDKATCITRMQECALEQIPMKWTGVGCTRINAKGKKVRMKDGGCQCKGYCGYKCPTRCDADEECLWDLALGKCTVKATGEVGTGILECPHEYTR